MSNIEQYGYGAGRVASGRFGRAIGRIEGSTCVTVARVEARGDIQAAQVDVLSAVTQRAPQGAAFISQVEAQLGQAVPMAASRLQAVGDIGALGLSQIVMDTANKLRRI